MTPGPGPISAAAPCQCRASSVSTAAAPSSPCRCRSAACARLPPHPCPAREAHRCARSSPHLLAAAGGIGVHDERLEALIWAHANLALHVIGSELDEVTAAKLIRAEHALLEARPATLAGCPLARLLRTVHRRRGRSPAVGVDTRGTTPAAGGPLNHVHRRRQPAKLAATSK